MLALPVVPFPSGGEAGDELGFAGDMFATLCVRVFVCVRALCFV